MTVPSFNISIRISDPQGNDIPGNRIVEGREIESIHIGPQK